MSDTIGTSASVSVVICAYTEERWEDLRRAVDSILRQRRPADEIIVVTDHNEPLRERARAAFAPAVAVIPNTGPRGLSGARNTGVQRATSEVIAFLDDDARADEEWLARLIRPYAHPSVQGTGGLVVPAWPGEGRPDWFPPEFGWVVGCSYPGLPTTLAPIRNPIGAAMSLRRSAWTATAGFTNGLGRLGTRPLGCEETDLYIRIRRDVPGATVLHVPDAVVTHQVTAQRATWGYFRARCYAEGLSKATVSARVGTVRGLASERAYVRSVLPRAVARDLRRQGNRRRAAAIVAGLAFTTAGYAHGRLRAGTGPGNTGSGDTSPRRPSPRRATPAPASARVDAVWTGELDLADPTAAPRRPVATGWSATWPLADTAPPEYRRARILVRWHGVPVGFVELGMAGSAPTTATVRSVAERELAGELARVRADVDRLGPLTEPDGTERGSAERASTERASTERVSVVVCTRDRSSLLPACLERLRALRYTDLEVIIVDNAPSDELTRLAFEQVVGTDPRFRYVREETPGLSHARNRGLAAATGTVVAYTDDDVAVDPCWVTGLVRGLDRRADVACVTGLVPAAALDSAAERYFDARVGWGTSCQPRVYDATSGPSALHPFAAGLYGTGANFAVRTAVLRELGGFDPALGAGTPTRGGEDLDLFLRVLLAGHALAYEPSALAWHGHRADVDALRRQLFGYGTGLSAYLTKHLTDPRSRRRMIRQVPAAARHLSALTIRGHGTAGERREDQPERVPSLGLALAAREWIGLLAGPVIYARSLRRREATAL
ncbi:putative glycosyltransferase [Frankia sp. EI5c]|uniref:glycosyltransferase family 2 protein n=1 Tax=Frankia sp. EI5c TaxID=683316 RepID=UPI0007C3521E|nr:glycosyltransferase family 2 protein [Frankia sp. EI5c]OAA24203.1 putative glycosyltransferase [Frankia sp. EI5c]